MNILLHRYLRYLILGVVFSVFVLATITATTSAQTAPAAGGQAAPGKCGSVGYNLTTCDCVGATAVCVTDSSKCSAPQGVYPIAYVNVGRCYPGKDCPAGGVGRGGLQASEGGWNEPWINLKSAPGIARAERLIQEAKSKGYKAFDPDNTAEAVDTADMKMLVDIGQKYGMKISLKNEEGQWAKLLTQYPQYKQNVVMVTQEQCAKHGDCGKYVIFKSLGIPVTHIEYSDSGGSVAKLQQAIATVGGAGMLVPNIRQLRGVTSLGSVCVNESGITPGPGPTPEQLAALSNGQQPYQQGNTSPGSWASQSAPGQWAGAPASSLAAQPANYNPGANQWKQQDFDRLQPTAQPTFLDPNKPLPKTGEKNPFVKDADWKDEVKKEEVKPAVKKAQENTEFFDPLLGTKGTQSTGSLGSGAQSVGTARIRCMPSSVTLGVRPTLAWSCGKKGVASSGDGFDSRNKPLGSARAKINKTTTFAISCFDGNGEDIGTAQCTVTVRKPVSGDEAFKSEGAKPAEEKKGGFCLLSFCL